MHRSESADSDGGSCFYAEPRATDGEPEGENFFLSVLGAEEFHPTTLRPPPYSRLLQPRRPGQSRGEGRNGKWARASWRQVEHDRERVIQQSQEGAKALQFASPALRAERGIVLAAVMNPGMPLEFAS